MYPFVRELAVDRIPVTVTCRVLEIAGRRTTDGCRGRFTEADLTAVAGADLLSYDREGRLRARFERPGA